MTDVSLAIAGRKGSYEEFARFFANPTRQGLRQLLKHHTGELDQLDFKQEWPEFPALARHILGIANSGGGCIILGVTQKADNTLEATGLAQLRDKADVEKKTRKFIPAQLKPDILDFAFTDSEYSTIVGKKFQVIIIPNEPRYIPFVVLADGEGIQENTIYVRRGTNTERANYSELQKMLNRRLETEYSSQPELDFENELAQLKTLYGQIPPYIDVFEFDEMVGMTHEVENSLYPEESFMEFVSRMIAAKKHRIEALLKVEAP